MPQVHTSPSTRRPEVSVEALLLPDAGRFPNNPALPVLVYRRAFAVKGGDLAARIEATFTKHGWRGCWRDAVYDFDHYHSNAHEVLGCYEGSALVQLGGPEGERVELQAGDVLLLPAGTAHRSLDASDDFAVIGAYDGGRAYDMRCGDPRERPESDARIAQVPMPERDPVYGKQGPLHVHWR